MWTSIGRFKSGIDTLNEPHSFANGLSEVFPRAVILTDGDRTPVTGAVDDGLEAWALCKGSAGVADLDILSCSVRTRKHSIKPGSRSLSSRNQRQKWEEEAQSGTCQVSSDALIGLESMQKATFSDARRSAVSRWRKLPKVETRRAVQKVWTPTYWLACS